MGLLGVPVRTTSNMKELAEALEDDVFQENLWSSWRELVADVHIQAEGVLVGLTLEVNKKKEKQKKSKVKKMDDCNGRKPSYPMCS